MSRPIFGKVTICLLLLWTCLTQAARAESVEMFVLPNGLRVVLQKDESQPVVGIAMGYGNGSLHDPPGYAELAHLCEHLMMLAPAPHTGSTWERMRMVGADQGAITFPTEVLSYAQLPREQLETALWIESERMAFAVQARAPSRAVPEVAVRMTALPWGM